MTQKPETVAYWRGRLPHWEVVEGRYFVTIRLVRYPSKGKNVSYDLAARLDKIQRDRSGSPSAITAMSSRKWNNGWIGTEHVSPTCEYPVCGPDGPRSHRVP